MTMGADAQECTCGTLTHLGTGRKMIDLNARCPEHGHLPPEGVTPTDLRKMADWFDNPQVSPPCPISLSHVQPAVLECIQPGYLLRRIADELEEQNDG